jgi:MFS family permease
LRNAAFFRVWAAGALNGVMRWLELLVVGLYVFQQTGSPFLTALVSVLRLLPMALFGPHLGVLADALGRRRLYLILTGAAALVALAQLLLAASDSIAFWHLAVGAFLSGAYWTADMPIRRILLGEIAGSPRVAQAMAYDTFINNVTRMGGPLLGGGMLQLSGLTGTFAVSLLTTLGALLLVLRVPDPGRPAGRSGGRVTADLMDGVRLARASPLVIGLLLITVLYNAFSFPAVSMVPVVGEGILALSPLWVGLLSACEGAGATLGSLMLAYFGRPKWHRTYYWGGVTLCLLSILLFSQASWPPLAGLALFAMGFGLAGFSAMQTTLMFLAAPAHARSRLMGLVSFCIGTAPLGLLHIGWLADELGAQQALLVMAAEGVLCMALVLWRWPALR